MPLETIKLGQVKDEDQRIRALLIGSTGSGKTIAAASWPGKTLIIDFDRRYKPVIDWYAGRLDDFTVKVVTPKTFWDFVKLINELADYCPYDNIILDSITNLSNCCVVMQMREKGAISKEEAEQAKKDNKKLGIKLTRGGVSIPTWDEINGETMIISELLEVLKSFNVNLFVSAHPLRREKDGSEYASLVTFGPKIESIIPTYFDEIWFFKTGAAPATEREELKREVYFKPSGSYKEARTAIKGMPTKVDITGKNLYEQVKQYL